MFQPMSLRALFNLNMQKHFYLKKSKNKLKKTTKVGVTTSVAQLPSQCARIVDLGGCTRPFPKPMSAPWTESRLHA